MEKEQYQAAVDLLKPLAARPDVSKDLLAQYGKALLLNQSPSRAIWVLQRAAEGAPPDSEVARMYARSLLAGGDPIAAVRELDRLIDQVPENPILYEIRARAHQRNLALELALEDLEVLIDLRPNDLGAFETRIQLLRELDHIAEAREAVGELGGRLEKLGAPPPVRGRYCASAALFEHQSGESELAREKFSECIAQYPSEPDVLLPWMIFLDDTGDQDEATQMLESAVAGGGAGRLRLRVALADRYAQLGKRAEASAVLEKAAEDLKTEQPYFALADHRVAWGELEGAEEALNRAIKMRLGRAPGEPGFLWSQLPEAGRFAMGDILIRVGRFDRVDELIASLEGEEGEPVYPLILRARRALEQDDPALALENFQESFKYWPSNIGARYYAARSAMLLGQFDDALSFYTDAFRAEATQSDMGLLVARMHLAQGQLNAAIDTMVTLLGASSQDPEAVRLFANLASQIGAVHPAEEYRRDLYTRLARPDEAMADQASDLLALQGLEPALSYLEAEPAFGDPRHWESWLVWVNLRSQKGDEEKAKAIERVARLRAENEDSAEVELLWCRLARQLDHPADEQVAACKAAVDRDPTLVEAAIDLGRLYAEAGQLEEAEATFDLVLASNPGHLDAMIGRADVAVLSDREEEARALYRKAVLGHPWYGLAASALARMAFDQGDHGDETLLWARWGARFNEIDPATAGTLLAEVRLARGETEEAIAAGRMAIERSRGPNPWPLYVMGQAFAERGENERAVAALTDALAIGDFSKADEARALLARLTPGGPS